MDHDKKAQQENSKLGSRDYEVPKKGRVCKSSWRFFWAYYWASENYTGRVDFESHSPKWRVLSKFNFQHC